MRNTRQKKKEGQARHTLSLSSPSLSSSDLSDQKFGPQPSKARRIVWLGVNNVQIFTPALENMTALLFI